jgi:diadenosine tetraphosphate (Ap4A) HIT family hydrolase
LGEFSKEPQLAAFQLHPQLAADTHPVCDLSLSRVLLMNDKRFPWLILVPMRDGMRDLIDLMPGDQADVIRDINRASRVVQMMFKSEKLNIAALGNITPQLHIHVIARFAKDAAWPKPVWGVGEAEKYSADEAKALIEKLKSQLV